MKGSVIYAKDVFKKVPGDVGPKGFPGREGEMGFAG